MSRATELVDRTLFGPESPSRLRVVQSGLAALVGVRVAVGPFTELDGQPAALFQPPWFLSVLHEMPTEPQIAALQVVGVAAAAVALGCAVLGRSWWRPAFVTAVASLAVLGGLHASRGKIQHNELLLLWACLPVLFGPSPAAARTSGSEPSPRWGWPVRASMATIGTIYFLTGAQKVVIGGPAWVFGDNMVNVMWRAALADKGPTDAITLFVAERPLLAHLVAAVVVATELGAPAAVVWPRLRPWFVAAIVVLHGSIYLTHGLDYSAWAATVVIVFVDWPAVWRSLHARPRRAQSSSSTWTPTAR